jgi:hypothetical protein
MYWILHETAKVNYHEWLEEELIWLTIIIMHTVIVISATAVAPGQGFIRHPIKNLGILQMWGLQQAQNHCLVAHLVEV